MEQPFLYSVNLSFRSTDEQSELGDAKIKLDDAISSPTPFLATISTHVAVTD